MTTPATEPVYFLLVDDLEENLLALEGLLRRDGLKLLLARSGVEALELLLRHDIALALIDIQMPAMDGFELAELMRGTERTRRVPIIFLTAGSTDRSRRFRGYEAGAVDFLEKPLETHILRSKAEVFFELFRQRQEVAQQRDELKSATEEITRLLKESRQYSQALQEADQRKDEFLAMLAHELRNPLAPVRNAVEILRLEGLAKSDVAQAREIISRQVSHMARLVDDLLDVARIARGKVRLRSERCDLATVVRQTAEDYRATITEAGVELQVTVPDDRIDVEGDPIRLAQVVGNLLHNARKFTPGGGRVRVRAERDASTWQAVVIVEDTGSGLDETVKKRLFEPFSQADQTFERDKGGLGLGLALVRGLIELHSGTVTAESPGPGRGSTFTLRLPLAEPQAETPDSPDVVVAETTQSRLRILLVEDNRDAALTLKLLLTLMGHQVAVAFDGPDGLAQARLFLPEVVISDLGLPGGLDGYALAEALRAEAALSPVYLVALSGYGQDDDQRRALCAGFDRHLVKPVEQHKLAAALDSAMKRRASIVH
ncbi:ATP-binding response regulator [Schlesneria paludicola]|uniref:ATP-binding response regulator n=1 Tax=Schlesneria paludicola TaxID=360056 RepID=UPI00029B1F42|nr:response regulator [Schlesneria paludicola]